MRKQIPVFWISLSFLYLLVEVMFRADVIHLAATSGDQHQLIAMEHVGRFISSFGVALFIASLLKTNHWHSDTQKRYRRLAMVPVFIGTYLLSAYTQEWAIEKYASEAPVEFKREVALANTYRDMMYFGKSKQHPDMQWLTSDEKVLLALTPVLVYGDPALEKITTASYRDVIEKINLMKLQESASLSDPRVFDYHRQWVKAIGWEYQRQVTERNDPANATISNDKKKLYQLMLKDGWWSIKSAAKQDGVGSSASEPSYSEYVSAIKADNWVGLNVFRQGGPALLHGSTGFDVIFQLSDAKYVLDKFDQNIAAVYRGYLNSIKKSTSDDVSLKWFFDQGDYASLKKYYNLNISMRDVCKAHPGKANELMLVTGANDNQFLSYPLSERLTKDLHVMLTGSIQKSPVLIACNYTYSSAIKQMRGLKETLSQRVPAYNPAMAGRLANSDESTVKRSSMFKYAAVSVMLEEERKLRQLQHRVNKEDKTARPALTRFADMAQYDRFVKAIDLSTVESFDRSLRAARNALSREAFLKWTSAAGLDFGKAMQVRPGFRFYNLEVFEDPALVSVFKKTMPQIFNEKGRFIALDVPATPREVKAFVKQLPEQSKNKIRALYAEMLARKQGNVFDDSSLFEQGANMEDAGEKAAKGFIAPSFVLFVSNIMIALTLISVVSTLLQAYFFDEPSVLRSGIISLVAAFLLLGPCLLIKNDHIQSNVDPSRQSLIVQQAGLTANLQKVYDILLPSFVRPTWVYQVIKIAVSPKERFVTLF